MAKLFTLSAKCSLCHSEFIVIWGCPSAIKAHQKGSSHQKAIKKLENAFNIINLFQPKNPLKSPENYSLFSAGHPECIEASTKICSFKQGDSTTGKHTRKLGKQ